MATSDTVETPRQGRHRKAETPERVYWACVAGILLWAVLRELGVDPGAEPIRFWPFVAVLAVAAINLVVRNRFSAARRRKGSAPSDRQGGPVGAVFVAVDFITIVAGLRFTGGIASAVWARQRSPAWPRASRFSSARFPFPFPEWIGLHSLWKCSYGWDCSSPSRAS